MKKTILNLAAIVMSLLLVFSLAGCSNGADNSANSVTGGSKTTADSLNSTSVNNANNPSEATGLWATAIYLSDADFGNGAKSVQVELKIEEKSVTFTIHTDKETLGEALTEHKLVEGENGPYGLYVKTVNGILADYDVDGSYWSFTKNGETLMTGVDAVTVADGEHYEITYTK